MEPQLPVPENVTLLEIRVFIEVTEFTCGHRAALIQHDRCPSKEEDLDTKPDRGRGKMRWRRRAQGCIARQLTPEVPGVRVEARTGPTLGPSEEVPPCWHPDFELLASRRVRHSRLSRCGAGNGGRSRPHFAHEEAEAQWGAEALPRRPQQGHAAGIHTQPDPRFLTLSTGHTATHTP